MAKAPRKAAARKPKKSAAKPRKAPSPKAPAQEAKGGRPPYEPTAASRKLVEQMSGTGAPSIDIAKILGIDPKTLRKHYREELDLGFIKANHAVSGSLYKQATKGNVAAAIWWEKTRQGRSEKLTLDGPGGGPIPVEVTEARTPKEAAEAYARTLRDQ